jgi:hypothetical protein
MEMHLSFLTMLERRARLNLAHLIIRIGSSFDEYHRRGWLYRDDYLPDIEVPFLDSDVCVEVEIDEPAGQYFYFSPNRRSLRVSRPLSEIALYRVAVDRWLDDLTTLIGIRPIHQSRHRQRIEHHLWHLGDLRFEDSRRSCPIFVVLRPHLVAIEALAVVLADPIWSDPGLVLVDDAEGMSLPGPHAVRGLSELVWVNADDEIVFDHRTLERLLSPSSSGEEPEQYLKGDKVKLPHFPLARELSAMQIKVIKSLWGDAGLPPPEMRWADVNRVANTGYSSFEDTFGSAELREDFVQKIRYGVYQLRRKP